MRNNVFSAVLSLCFAVLLASAAAPSAALAVGDDGSLSGSVVEVGDEPLVQETPEGDAPSSRKASASDDEALQGSPEPLEDSDNVIDEGQVSDSSFLYDAALADLAGADSYYDGQTVQVTGEAVGEAIYADGSHSWITLVDVETDSSVVVYMSDSDLPKIDTFGAYGRTGTTLRVQGVYHLACSEHDGESDIHAAVVNVAALGATHTESLHIQGFIPGIVFTVVGALLMALFWHMRERSR